MGFGSFIRKISGGAKKIGRTAYKYKKPIAMAAVGAGAAYLGVKAYQKTKKTTSTTKRRRRRKKYTRPKTVGGVKHSEAVQICRQFNAIRNMVTMQLMMSGYRNAVPSLPASKMVEIGTI